MRNHFFTAFFVSGQRSAFNGRWKSIFQIDFEAKKKDRRGRRPGAPATVFSIRPLQGRKQAPDALAALAVAYAVAGGPAARLVVG